jgi:hypothetical protein
LEETVGLPKVEVMARRLRGRRAGRAARTAHRAPAWG